MLEEASGGVLVGGKTQGAPRVRRVSEKISVSLLTSCVIWPVWGSLSAVALLSDRLAASLRVRFMLVFCTRHLWTLDLWAWLYTSSHWWIVSFKCAILAENCGWVGEGTSFRPNSFDGFRVRPDAVRVDVVVVGADFLNHCVCVLLNHGEGSIVDAGEEPRPPFG